jgi:hypothetical protein
LQQKPQSEKLLKKNFCMNALGLVESIFRQILKLMDAEDSTYGLLVIDFAQDQLIDELPVLPFILEVTVNGRRSYGGIVPTLT